MSCLTNECRIWCVAISSVFYHLFWALYTFMVVSSGVCVSARSRARASPSYGVELRRKATHFFLYFHFHQLDCERNCVFVHLIFKIGCHLNTIIIKYKHKTYLLINHTKSSISHNFLFLLLLLILVAMPCRPFHMNHKNRLSKNECDHKKNQTKHKHANLKSFH